jgi:opacity protein-like surface antigen
MKRMMLLLPAIMFLSLAVHAQDIPQWEISGGGSYMEADLNHKSFHLAGGGGSLTENLNSWFGGRLEANFYSGTVSNVNVSAQTITYGPTFSYRRFDRFVPFGNFQLGGIHGSKGYLGISESAFKFDMTGGGGIDYIVNNTVAIRAEGDYMMTRFLDLRQDNLRFSVGLVIRFGSR